ncbi:SDR family NAD(P)-dependent oxidoreductase [Allofrancisella frigidaquae]|uniref:SDR family oxidoreductase n=1 Tax=Allofrancisella frigidaquae TaxID=1085644 RepID=A0A6M3HY32_9GAMM|nr:SDR family oxidoreductase [Allofrancisella frigidaquae]QIV94556.1 SDR family oxidoreductase [Allofrancisella frigidaquae]
MRNYLVTGGSKGIGKAVVDLLLQKEENYIINLDILEPELNLPNINYIKIDLTDYSQIKVAMESLPPEISFDGIFLNAGMLIKGSIFDLEIEEIQKVINLNVWANIYIIKALNGKLKKEASIVFNGSDQCFIAKPNSFAYTLSKGAIAQMTKSLALDLAKDHIRVNTICPGTVDTQLYRSTIKRYADSQGIEMKVAHSTEEQEFPLGRIAQPQEIAELVYFLLSDKSKFMTGGLIPIDGGYTAK